MALVDAEFEKIALATNPSIAANKEIADAKTVAEESIKQQMTTVRYNQDIKYKVGPLTPFIRLYDGFIKQDMNYQWIV